MVGGHTSNNGSGEGSSARRTGPWRRSWTGEDPGWCESTIQGSSPSRKGVGRSWGRGRNSHRILRRVPAEGRHPRPNEPSFFTERWSRGSRRLPPARTARAKARRHGGRGRGDRGVRGSIVEGAVGIIRPRSGEPAGTPTRTRFSCPRRSAEAVSGVVKHSVLRSSRAEQRLHEASTRWKPRQWAGNARGAGARSSRSGGRSRSDASRVLPTESSQVLLEEQAGR